MGVRRIAPHIVAGLFGMLLVTTLYIAHALLLRGSGHGLGAGWLILILLPGALAAHLGTRIKGAVQTGLLTGHVAAGVQIAWLIIAVITTDWARYTQQVGPEIAYAVRDLAVPATALASAIAIVVTYAGCIMASLLGSAIYLGLRNILVSK